MSARNRWVLTVARIGFGFAGLLVMTVLLAAMPRHRAAAQQNPSAEAPAQQPQEMPGMDMSDEKASEKEAVSEMTPGHRDSRSLHMTMTATRSQTPEDVRRAEQVVTELRAGIEKYKDYHAALNDGFKIFLPNLPQPEYHFTNYWNGFMEAFSFDPARPSSLLYRKTATGYELVGAMYTMPKKASVEQLNERVPLSVAMWHLHTNLCMPPREQMRSADWSKFGLRGSIATEDACSAAGGRFRLIIFGWMVHVYPYEDSLDKIFACITWTNSQKAG